MIAQARRVEIHLGTLCNNLCPFCMSGWGRDQKEPWASRERVREELRHFRAQGCSAVGFLGGEPTVYPHILDSIAYAKSLGYETISVCTNGTRLSSPDFCRRLVDAGLTRATVSVHSHRPEIEDGVITRVPGNLARKVAAIENLVALRRAGALRDNVSLNPVLGRPNLAHIEGFVAFFERLGVDDIRFNYIWPEGAARDDRGWVPSWREAMPVVARALLRHEKSRSKTRLSFGGVPKCALRLSGATGRLLDYLADKYFDEAGFEAPNDVSIATHDGPADRFVWQESKRNDLKTKAPACAGCRHEPRCEGVWRSYAALHGLAEVQAL